MGGNALFNALLTDGGMLCIDDGRPTPGLFDETLRKLREVSPSYYDKFTDKGYINQRAGLDRRAARVDRLYAAVPDGEVIVLN